MVEYTVLNFPHNKWQSQDLNPDPLTLKSHTLPTLFHHAEIVKKLLRKHLHGPQQNT